EQFEDDLEARPLKDFISVDAHADIPLTSGFALTLSGENITDSRIEDGIDIRGATTLAQPRTFWAGIRWTG
ncbi:MAG: TonB-dependent receptor, partial [Pacificimonas sp.]